MRLTCTTKQARPKITREHLHSALHFVPLKIRLFLPYFFFCVFVSFPFHLCSLSLSLCLQLSIYQSIFLPPQNSISSCPIVKIKASSQNHTRDQQLGLVDLQGGVPVAFEAILGVYVGSGCNVYVGVSDSFEKGRKTG